MASTIKVKRSAVQGKAPTTGNLDTGELALNTRDGRLYSKGTQVFEVGANNHSLFIGTGGATFANGAYTLPTADGSADQILKTNGSGTLSFADADAAGGSIIFYEYDGTRDDIALSGTLQNNALANTNAYIASVSATERSALANTNAYIASISADLVTDTTPQLGGNLDLNSRDITGTGNITITGNYTGTGNITNTGNFDLISTDAGSSAAPELTLYRNSSSPADADYLGQLRFEGENDAGQNQLYAKITGKIGDASDGTEDGILEIAHVKAGSQNISARFTSSTLKLLNGTTFELKGQDSDTRYANNTIATPRTGANNSVKISYGTTAERDGSPDTGFFRYNVTTASAEIYDGSAWGEVGGGGGATGGGNDQVFYENGQTITTSYTITTNTNAMSTGPLTVNSGVSVTVPSGSRWVVL